MSMPTTYETCVSSDITLRLQAWHAGDKNALDPVMPELYDRLRQIAASRLRAESTTVTLDPTDLVHEALACVFGADKRFANRAHFLAVGALYMRSILVDRARSIVAGRRLGANLTITLRRAHNVPGESGAMDVVELDDTMRQLERIDARAAKAQELAYFGGMTREEIAQALDISVPTVDRDLYFARAFVNRALAP